MEQVAHERNVLPLVLVGVYAWLATVRFGAVLLDGAYASVLRRTLGETAVASVFASLGDALLQLLAACVAAALAALAAAAHRPRVRAPLAARAVLLLAPVLVLPMLAALDLSDGSGRWLRWATAAGASALALLALSRCARTPP